MKRVRKHKYSPECPEMYILLEFIVRGRDYFRGKNYMPGDLIMHLPPPVQNLLLQSMDGFGVNKAGNGHYNILYIMGIRCVPAYENRIVISHPEFAIYDNEPMVVIEFDVKHGYNYPTYIEKS